MDEIKKFFDDNVYTDKMDDADKLLINAGLIFDAACMVGGFLLARNAINKYLEPAGPLQKIAAFGLELGIAGKSDFNVGGHARNVVMERIKKNGRSEDTEE